jgi:benzodiazapine receptor
MDSLRKWVNVLAAIGAIAFNGLAVSLPLNGRDTGAISDSFKVFFVPAGYVFAIWGVIYVGLIAFAVFQALPSQAANPRVKRIGWLVALSCLANCFWLVCWHYGLLALSVLVMLTLLGLLIVIYLRAETGGASVSLAETWCVRVPFSIYLGWITVATVANITDLLWSLGWGGLGLDPQVWAVIMLVAAFIIASAVAVSRGDVAYMLVIVWAFAGIGVKQAGAPVVSTAAWVMTALAAGMCVLGPLMHGRRLAHRAGTGGI